MFIMGLSISWNGPATNKQVYFHLLFVSFLYEILEGQGQASMNWTIHFYFYSLDSDSLLFNVVHFGALLVYTKLVVVDEWCHSEHKKQLKQSILGDIHYPGQYFITTIVIFLENERYNTCTKITIIHSRTFCYGDILLHRHHHFLTLNIC
ncbi:hypothetical protein ACJX0J_023599 [Zea mays]